MLRTLTGMVAGAAVLLCAWDAPAQWVQQGHYDTVPHTTTHLDYYQHGNHVDAVPHTTTHFDQVYHPTQQFNPVPYVQPTIQHGQYYPSYPNQQPTPVINQGNYYPQVVPRTSYHPPYPHIDQSTHIDYVPHTTTHLDYVPHGNHFDVVPHTTTHLHAVPHTTQQWHQGPVYQDHHDH